MKKLLFALFLCVFGTVVANAETKDFLQRFNETVEYNQQFSNPNLVYPGDTIYVPVIAKEAGSLGHDCMWKIAKRTDVGMIPYWTPIDQPAPTTLSASNSADDSDQDDTSRHLLIAILVLVLIACILGIILLFRRAIEFQSHVHIHNPVPAPAPAVPATSAPALAPAPATSTVDIQININGQEVSIQSSETGSANRNLQIRVNLTQPTAVATESAAVSAVESVTE